MNTYECYDAERGSVDDPQTIVAMSESAAAEIYAETCDWRASDYPDDRTICVRLVNPLGEKDPWVMYIVDAENVRQYSARVA